MQGIDDKLFFDIFGLKIESDVNAESMTEVNGGN
jgi:hypothetical protein